MIGTGCFAICQNAKPLFSHAEQMQQLQRLGLIFLISISIANLVIERLQRGMLKVIPRRKAN